MKWMNWLAALLPLTGAELRILDVEARAGAMAQVRVGLSEPLSAASGSFAVEFDAGTFGDVADVQVFSAAGDAVGTVKFLGRRVEVKFTSSSGGVGRLPDLPVATIAVPVLVGAAEGQIRVELGSTPWRDVPGKFHPLTVRPGSVRLGAALTIGGVAPGGGVLPAGTVVRIIGTGFRPDTVVELPGVAISRFDFLSPAEMTFTIGGEIELTGKRVIARNPDGTRTEFVTALSFPSEAIVPARTLTGFRSGTNPNGLAGAAGFVIQNQNLGTVEIMVEKINVVGGLDRRQTISLGPGETIFEPDLTAFGVGTRGYVGFLASKPVRAALLSHPGAGLPNELTVTEVTGTYASYVSRTPLLRVSPPEHHYQYQLGTAAPAPRTVTITSVSGASDVPAFTFAAKPEWLHATRSPGRAGELTINIDAARLAAGTYSGEIAVIPDVPGAPELIIPISLTVSALPYISFEDEVGPYFEVAPGAPAPPPRTFRVISGGGPARLTASAKTESGGNWLSVTPSSATTPATFTFSVNPAGLAEGIYTGTITVEGAANLLQINASLWISKGRAPEKLSLTPAEMLLSYGAGAARESSFYITVNLFPLNYTVATSGESWLKAMRLGAGSGLSVFVTTDPRSLPVGTHTAKVIVTATESGETAEFPVTVNIWNGETPPLTVTPASVRLEGTSTIPGTGKAVVVTSGGTPLEVTVQAKMPPDSCSLQASPESSRPQQLTPVTLLVNCFGPPGDYEGTLTITAGTQSAVVPVSIHLDPPPYSGIVTPPFVAAIVNAASGLTGPVAPGQFIAIHGVGVNAPLKIDGIPVTPTSASIFQTNVRIPSAASGMAAIEVGPVSMKLPVTAAAPAVFTLNGTGMGSGAVLNEDNSVNSEQNPAARGSIVQIFGTGDGERAVLMEAFIGGGQAEVTYGGSYNGLWQMNIRVPDSASPGARVPLLLRVAGVSTQPGVTVAIR